MPQSARCASCASGRRKKPCPIWIVGPVEASRTRARAVSDAEMPTSRSKKS